MPLLVTRREVEGLLDLATAMEVTLAAFKEQAAGAVSTEPPRMLMTRRGAPTLRAIAVAATGSVGETTAPRTNAGSHAMPVSQCAIAATPMVVNSTSPTASIVIGRRLRWRSRSEEKNAAE